MFFASRQNRENRLSDAPSLSLLAVVIAAALQVPYASAAETTKKEETLVVDATTESASTPQATDYNVPVTRAATKMALTARDTPQSVSVISKQRMQDQQLQSLDEVLRNTTGISEFNSGTSRSNFYSRGFTIDNYMVDGISTTFEDRWNLGDALSDTAIYERIEVVRGATGLMTGAGNPAASVNMVRKHADSKEFVGNVSASYGSWDKQRYVADLSAPLSESGNVRGRVVAGYQDQDSWLDRNSTTKKFLYGVLDADLTDSTTVSVGYDYQQTNTKGATWNGLPGFYTDGSKTNYDRSTSTAPDWAYNDKTSKKVFASLKQDFANGWNLTVNGAHTEVDFDGRMLYIDGYFDKTTGIGVSPYANYPVVGGTGWNSGTRKVDAVDAFASGPYELLGRQHELMAGITYSRQHNRYMSSWANISPEELGNFNNYNGNFPETDWNEQTLAQDDTVHQKSAYTATRISLADPLHLLIGARYTKWSSSTMTQEMAQNHITPYAGLIYDINDTWSTYASYTSIFKPQSYRDTSGSYLSPVTGNNYETGVKADWLNSRITTSFAVFRIEQDNVAQSAGSIIPGSTETAYYGAKGTVSKGVEFEINGAVTDNLQMTFGATRYVAKDAEGEAVNSNLPRTSLKLFTSYRLPMLQDLTVGGGVNWQTHVWDNVAGPNGEGTFYAEQGSYALVDLFGRYQVTRQLSVQANLNNLFDKTYNMDVSGTTVYGAPRNVSVSANYSF
ncbi:ferric-rhodotorulic acid/ferric-coprogen receptor FhuE [Erwiniaceae bacterium BAC15a-03b]|uniref:Ferric-rhodotorulic acid/ferric-coprogen receptor FhuE n=1 Tax=Winslowiella arboricola TaxID=2978220 RepID=A0A9J6PX21_9GAMM|nr:ferric-rhodotorulic acid/ferric-coprogen receptor FhuE [Winslowiella arboricola]MCU5772105.1 ferric-rhodotorulic acid/ferric-coprogen receptor FhuE [Winslowiella arboricola]MCU5778559.1 ferric-rhodotorulic acid/ferric-coprogen receptor FhuE [Winslowiella arboricola]